MLPAHAKLIEWRYDTALFARDNFQFEPDKWQLEAFRALDAKDTPRLRVALKACAGPGKTAVLAIYGWKFLSTWCQQGAHPKGAAIATTKDNLDDNLWPEFSKWQQRSPFLRDQFTWTKSRIFANCAPETWFLSARSYPKTADENEQGRTLSGLHSDYVLYLIDESGDIPISVLKSAEQGLSNCKFGRIIQAGNPTSMTGMLYASCTDLADKWETITITGDPDDPNRSPRIDKEWAIEQIKTYGRNDPWVMAYILGLFPPVAMNALIGPDEVDAAMNRIITEAQVAFSDKRIGVDCARFGDDRTFIARRQGLAALEGVTMRNARSEEIAARVASIDSEWKGSDLQFIDSTGGWGAGVEDALRLAQYKPIPINFSSTTVNNPRYFNRRTEMIYEFCEWIKRGGCLPKSPQLKKELCAHTYFFQNGKIRVAEKDQVKKLIKCSPDEMDAYALTFALPDRPRPSEAGQELTKRRNRAEFARPHNYDPFSEENNPYRDNG